MDILFEILFVISFIYIVWIIVDCFDEGRKFFKKYKPVNINIHLSDAQFKILKEDIKNTIIKPEYDK